MSLEQKLTALKYAGLGFVIGVFVMLEIARRMGKL